MVIKLMQYLHQTIMHAILSKCYERYLNDTVLTALSAVYHILYPNINQFEQPVSRRHLICSDIEIHIERFSAKSKSQRSAVVIWHPGMILMEKSTCALLHHTYLELCSISCSMHIVLMFRTNPA